MSCNYRWYELQQLVNIKYGKNQKKVQDNEKGQYPIYGTGGLMGYAKEFLYDKPSVLIGRKGSISKVKYVEHPFWTVDTLFYTEVNNELVMPKYLYYKLSLIDFNYYNEGTTIPSLRTDTLKKIELQIPTLKIQELVVKLLNSLDDKIELNNEMNKTLEEMAQALFKRWFVDFEFPNEEGKPYKSSGGEMVESELGMIPKGWKVVELDNFMSFISRGHTPKYSDFSKIKVLNQKVNKGYILEKQYYKYLREDSKISKDKFANKFDVLLNCLGQGTLGRVHLYKELSEDVVIDQFITIIRDEKNPLKGLYVYNLFNTNEYQRLFENLVTGSTGMWVLNVTKVRSIKIIKPEDKILNKYLESMCSIYDKIGANNLENESNTCIRNTLLPKLMSGEIRVEDIEANL